MNRLGFVHYFTMFCAVGFSFITTSFAAPDIFVSPMISKMIQTYGHARVIVRLKVDFDPHASISINERRAKIKQAQDQFLMDLRTVFQPSKEHRFTFIPHVALDINRAALEYMVRHPLVTGIELDTLQSPL